MKRIHESLYILLLHSKIIEIGSKELGKITTEGENLGKNKGFYLNLLRDYTLLATARFFEEFDDMENRVESSYHKRIAKVKKVVAPILKRKNKWTDIKKYRNHFIAHPFRRDIYDEKNKRKLLERKFALPELHQYNIPNSPFEVLQYTQFAKYVFGILKHEFTDELTFAFSNAPKSYIKPSEKVDQDKINQDLEKMIEEVNSIIKEVGGSYPLAVAGYILEKRK